jgi:hypothetical protein
MTAPNDGPECALCNRPMTIAIEPPRRTLARSDPSDDSYSVTAILPDVPLCDEHEEDVRHGERQVGWCDDPLCRTFGEVGKISPCGDQYTRLTPGNRSRSSRSQNHL